MGYLQRLKLSVLYHLSYGHRVCTMYIHNIGSPENFDCLYVLARIADVLNNYSMKYSLKFSNLQFSCCLPVINLVWYMYAVFCCLVSYLLQCVYMYILALGGTCMCNAVLHVSAWACPSTNECSKKSNRLCHDTWYYIPIGKCIHVDTIPYEIVAMVHVCANSSLMFPRYHLLKV